MRNVRIDCITIKNFKNVINGNIEFNNKNTSGASVLGLYGQNGSGKTTLIDAIAILKNAISGKKIPNYYADLINVDSDFSSFEYVFSLKNNDNDIIYLYYNFSLRRENVIENEDSPDLYYCAIFNEQLSISKSKDGKVVSSKQEYINTANNYTFGPKVKYSNFFGDSKEIETDIIVSKKISYNYGTSFIFSKSFMKILYNSSINKEPIFFEALETIVQYAERNLFVLSKKDSAIVNFDTLQLFFKIGNNLKGAAGSIAIPIDGFGVIPHEAFEIVEKVITNMNIVLPQLVPGLIISVRNIGDEIQKDGSLWTKVQLFSSKNDKDIPLRYESEGIKKIVAILQLLIVIYNDSSVTAAIDELDSGVFEYLLGEMLKIISESGKGQLIFTSHNLRPLETISKSYVAFTTINPENRYIRFVNLKPKNNLRDYYYRDIILGEDQAEITYEKTNNRMIAFAFKEAGDLNG